MAEIRLPRRVAEMERETGIEPATSSLGGNACARPAGVGVSSPASILHSTGTCSITASQNALVAETVQTASVLEANETVRPEVDVAVSCTVFALSGSLFKLPN